MPCQSVLSVLSVLKCKGAQPLILKMVPVFVKTCKLFSWVHINILKRANYCYYQIVLIKNLDATWMQLIKKFGCNFLAPSRNTPVLPLTALTVSFTYLREVLTAFSFRSDSCCFWQVLRYQTVSAMFAWSDNFFVLKSCIFLNHSGFDYNQEKRWKVWYRGEMNPRTPEYTVEFQID